jgi:cell division protein FtsN
MVIEKVLPVLILAAALGVSGCSRQQSDWEKTRTTNTTDAYELFLKKYPNGEFTAQAQARVKELYEERDWQKARDTDTLEAYQAFLKQYPEGKWTEEARIRVENFTLASAPSTAPATAETQPPPFVPAKPPAKAPAAAKASSAAKAPSPAKAPSAANAPAAKPHASAKTASQATGPYGVQLGAFKSGTDAANKRWAKLEKEYPKLLAHLSPKVNPGKSASGTLYRLQVTGLSEAHAASICSTLKSHSEACVVLHPQKG